MLSIRFAALSLLLGISCAHAAPTFVAEWPFHDCRGLICIDVALDGAKPRTLLLDTGNVNSVLTTDTAKALGWKLEPIVQDGKPVPGMQRGGEHRVAIGSESAPVRFLVLDRDQFGKDPPPGDGSIAYTFFKDRAIQIDYPNHKVRVSAVLGSDDAVKAPGTIQLITFGKQGPPIVVGAPFTVDGKTVRAQIDTCFTGTLVIYDAALTPLGMSKTGKPEYFPFTDGGINLLAAHAHKLGFADRSLINNGTLYFVGAGDNPVHQPDNLFEATVGNALFAHSVVTIDFHAMTLDVRPAG